jgi:hypothetical protein
MIFKSNWVTIKDNDDWLVEYDTVKHRYRVSYFEDGHFKDEVIFREYREE